MTLLTHFLAALAGVFFGAFLMATFAISKRKPKPRGYDALDEDAVRDWHGGRVG